MNTVPVLASVEDENEELEEEDEGDWRPTAAATMRKRSFDPLLTVELSHRPSRVASP